VTSVSQKSDSDLHDSAVIEALYSILKNRLGGDPEVSYTARLLSRGISKCAQKFGEEAIETVIAATEQDHAAVISESADLIYHWLVVLVALGVEPGEVFAEIKRRQGLSGLDEKAARRGGN
jgi:phosphoribosyl-ATP pyrophosphohydrolase